MPDPITAKQRARAWLLCEMGRGVDGSGICAAKVESLTALIVDAEQERDREWKRHCLSTGVGKIARRAALEELMEKARQQCNTAVWDWLARRGAAPDTSEEVTDDES